MAPRPTNPPAATNHRLDSESSPPRATFDSQPSDLALIETQLRPWVASGRKPAAYVHESDVYAAGPAELARTFAPAVSQDGERAWYFLTRLRLKSVHGRGKRIDRTIASGRGWWHGEAKQKPVVDGLAGREAGLRQAYSFMADDRGARVRTGWIMAELRLDAALEEGTPVLCKVYRSPRRQAVEFDYDNESSPPAPATPPAAPKGDADNDDESCAAAAAPEPNRDAADGEVSAVAAAAPAPAPGRNEKDAAGDEGSAETSAAAPERESKAADDEQSSSATRKRPAGDDGARSPDAARKRRKADGLNSPDDDDAASIKLHCPQCGCGFHLVAAAQAGVAAPAKSESETGVVLVGAPLQGGETGGDSSAPRDPVFYHFL